MKINVSETINFYPEVENAWKTDREAVADDQEYGSQRAHNLMGKAIANITKEYVQSSLSGNEIKFKVSVEISDEPEEEND